MKIIIYIYIIKHTERFDDKLRTLTKNIRSFQNILDPLDQSGKKHGVVSLRMFLSHRGAVKSVKRT